MPSSQDPVPDLGGAGKHQGTSQSRNHQLDDDVKERMDLEVSERITLLDAQRQVEENLLGLVDEHQQPSEAGAHRHKPSGIPFGWRRSLAHVIPPNERSLIWTLPYGPGRGSLSSIEGGQERPR